MQPIDDFDPEIGVAETLEPGLRRIVAPNPSPMTHRGTNTYLLGHTDIAAIDPGPSSPAHLEAILAALKTEQRITHIIVTHTHLDHSPMASALQRATGAPILAFGGPEAGRSKVMADLSHDSLIGGGEGVDEAFEPDEHIRDGDVIAGPDWRLDVIHTPGHIGNHICLGWNDACLTADHVMGWASSLVSPPDGDLTDFMTSCARLASRNWRIFYPGHGAAITAPAARLEWLMEHRRMREKSILDALKVGPATAREIARQVYTDTPAALLPAAERNVLAHLIDLMGKSLVKCHGKLGVGARFFKSPCDRP